MYLDYSKLDFYKDGIPETPEIILKSLSDQSNGSMGIIPGVFNLKFNIKLSEPSEISFDVPAMIDGIPNPLYDDITGYKQLYTKCYGIYVTMNPSTEEDGVSAVKHVHGFSYEKILESKKFFLEEGTFNFWNSVNPHDTVLWRIKEAAVGWNIGYVSPTLEGRYRTFDQFDDYLLSFIYNTAPGKFRCVFIFDTYKKTINVYDADEERPSLPIYLDFDNLLESVDIEELSDELVTAIRPYGADGLDIRAVNPIGTNWVYDVSYFINNGSIPYYLGKKWEAWQQNVINYQPYYRGLTALQASRSSQLLAEQAALNDLNGELDTLIAQQSVTIQALAMEKTEAGKASQQKTLDNINRQIDEKNTEISLKKNTISSIEWELDPKNPDSCTALIKATTDLLAVKNCFSEHEYSQLSHYFIEQDITENSFVATSVNTSVSGQSTQISSLNVFIRYSNISMIEMPDFPGKKMYLINGGYFDIGGKLSGDIIRGTLEAKTTGGGVMSLYVGKYEIGEKVEQSGMLTITWQGSNNINSDIALVESDGVHEYAGTRISYYVKSGSLYATSNVSDYQKYAVQMELYDYAVKTLHDLAYPTYEFSVDSGNFLFAQEFTPFRNELELGKGIYLNVGHGLVITPYIIEFELDFEDRSKFSILFSNRFKRHDYVNTLKDMLERSYSTSRNFDASKYIYNQTVGQASMVSKFMSDSLDAAKNTILAASNQSVIINGAGINVGSDSKYQLRIVDSMIAMTDDNWSTAKLAIGRFASPEIGEYWGVNAEVIGGKLIVGNNLIIENENDHGVMQFKVDSSGAWLYNSTFVLAQDGGGKILIDPKYGIAAGTSRLYSTSGTTVYPSFIGRNESIIKDSEGMPVNSNFFLDLRDGTAYFRGTVYAKNGTFSGKLEAATGKFNGIVQADRFLDGNGNDMMSAGKFKSDYLDLRGITIRDSNGNKSFEVTRNGDVTIGGTINGKIKMGPGSSINWANVTNTNMTSNPLYLVTLNAQEIAADAIKRANSAQTAGEEAIKAAKEAARSDREIFDIVTKCGADKGIFSIETDRDGNKEIFVCVNADYIRSGTLDASNIVFADANHNISGGICIGKGEDSYGNRTEGPILYGDGGKYNPYNYVIATDAGVGLRSGGAKLTLVGQGVFINASGVYSNCEFMQSSDKNLKNSISYDMSKYDDFFMSLSPTQYKYNDGKSDRYHVGFIAQDVNQALLDNGLTTNDFAGFVISKAGTGDPYGIKEDRCYLRYTEFISLNTHMIQKAHKRIEKLENKIRVLEEALH